MVARETLLGVVFFGALIGLGVLTVTLSDVPLFEKRWTYEVYFPDVKGLKSGDPVHVYGTKYGKVSDVSVTSLPSDSQRVRVTLVTNRPLDLRAGAGTNQDGRYRIFIRDQTLLGGKLIEVLVGTQGNPAVAPYFGTALEEPLRAVQMLVEDNRDKLSSAISHVSDLLVYIAEGKGSLGRFLVEEELYANIKHISSRAVEIADALAKDSNGSLAKLLHSSEAHDALATFLTHANDIAQRLKNGEGVLGQLLTDSEMQRSLKQTVAAVEAIATRIERGEGALGKLTRAESNQLVDDAHQFLAAAKLMVTNVNEGKGLFGRLMQDEVFANKVLNIVDRTEKAIDDIAYFTDHVRKGGGTLGLLLFDEVTRDRLVAVVDQLAGVIEDAREAAPVSSVASFLFGTF